MGFLCINKELKRDVDFEKLKEEKLLRDIGLSNINNVNPEINFCQEIFLSPEYYATGVIKLVSGYTSNLTGCTTGTTAIYNLDYNSDITVDFVITGDTSFKDYNGNFCVKMFSNQYWNADKATGGFVNGSELVGSCTSFSAITKSEPDILQGQINVGTLPYWMSLNTKDNLIYASNQGSANNISVIDADTNTVIETIVPGFTPAASAYDPINNQLFVIEDSINTVHVFDCNTNAVISIISFGVDTYVSIVYNSSNQSVCIGTDGGKIITIDCLTLTPSVFTNTSFTYSKLIVHNPIDNGGDGGLYVFSNAGGSSIDVVNALSGVLLSTIPVSGSPEFNGATFDSTNNRVYATIYNNQEILILDCVTGIYTTIATPTTFPYAIDFDSTNNNIFYSTFTDSLVYRLDATTNQVEKSFNFVSTEVRYILYNPINNTVYGTRYGNQKVAYITSNYVKLELLEGTLSKTWSEYLIRPYYQFISKQCNPGVIYDSWFSSVQYNTFQDSTDYYFMTVIDPPTPSLQAPGTEGSINFRLVTDKLVYNGYVSVRGSQAINNEANYFLLSSIPSDPGNVLVFLNGVLLTQGYDYDILNNGGYGTVPIVVINGQINPATDWLLATYISGDVGAWFTNLGSYFIDTIVLDSFTSTSTPSYRIPPDNTLNFNPVTNKYEFFTTLPINPDYAVMIMVNGVNLAPDEQFFKSTSFDGRIIFDQTTFTIGDVITVFAYSKNGVSSNNYGSLRTNSFTAQWSVPSTFTNNTVTGRFIVEAFDNTSGILTNQLYVDFVPGESNYEATFSNLSLNIYYKFKVTFEATYNGSLNNKVITCSYAEGYFDTTNNYINSTY